MPINRVIPQEPDEDDLWPDEMSPRADTEEGAPDDLETKLLQTGSRQAKMLTVLQKIHQGKRPKKKKRKKPEITRYRMSL